MANLISGDVWDSISVLNVEYKWVEEYDRGVTERYKAEVATLKCACGKVWEVKTKDVPPAKKRRQPDCGCGTPKTAENRKRNMKSGVCWSMTMESQQLVEKLAVREGWSMSRAAVRLVLAGAEKLGVEL